MIRPVARLVAAFVCSAPLAVMAGEEQRSYQQSEPSPSGFIADGSFDVGVDLIALHYDHRHDRDDGHSAAADRTMLESEYSCSVITADVIAVAGTYGNQQGSYQEDAEPLMATIFDPCGGYLSAHEDWDGAVSESADRWLAVLDDGGEVFVKEGGQSDLTADVIRDIKSRSSVDTKRIHVVQHSTWNEGHTTAADLAYVKAEAHYTKITDGNGLLALAGGDDDFVAAALASPFAAIWQAAFDYYDPDVIVDFSDTTELMHILETVQMSIAEFGARYFDDAPDPEGDGVVRMVLVDAETDADVAEINDDDSFSMTALDLEEVNIRAETDGTWGSVQFTLDGAVVGTESEPPYALAGDSNGNYSPWHEHIGSHVLVATPYTGANAGGDPGPSLTRSFEIMESTSTGAADSVPETGFKLMQPHPNPAVGNTTVTFALAEATNVALSLFDARGALVSREVSGWLPDGRHEHVIERRNLASGLYFVRLDTPAGSASTGLVLQ